ncbi:NADPH-dependent F420 reductase [Streptomyces sp. NBC_00878]|uniref:NADPH-dependent F420 reductase n=1 Tax=Streptomyces sp. NBC_00878 TaxID=2975854 RepID=UPI002256244C|nr:NAD(P)-binding domain-containing protein [Streptomyces sp. NBC_00878]MCX4905842.1 NAD(P)-binding domain-containing protein [Streptomyces sp. NBC_00878]
MAARRRQSATNSWQWASCSVISPPIIARRTCTDRCATPSLPLPPDPSPLERQGHMRIGILGTGTLAAALGEGWARAGHEVAIGGRSRAKAEKLAERLGRRALAVAPREAVTGCDAVLLAVSWDGVEDMLGSVGASDGVLEGMPLIDPTNAVTHGIGTLLTEQGESMAGRIAGLAPGARVVKAFHLFPADQWTSPPDDGQSPVTVAVTVTVAMCGDDARALHVVGELVRDVGGVPATLGPLDRARQLEEAAGFVIGLTFTGFDPGSAVPHIPSNVPQAR